jgi:hypothetical protein
MAVTAAAVGCGYGPIIEVMNARTSRQEPTMKIRSILTASVATTVLTIGLLAAGDSAFARGHGGHHGSSHSGGSMMKFSGKNSIGHMAKYHKHHQKHYKKHKNSSGGGDDDDDDGDDSCSWKVIKGQLVCVDDDDDDE